jgi:hypothetical protein
MSPSFYYRPFYNEVKFLESYPRRGPFDAALLRARHLAPHPAGSRGSRGGKSGRELAEAVSRARASYVVDVDTPLLAAAARSDLPPRAQLMAAANVLPLPLTPASFSNQQDRLTFVQVVVADQAGAAELVSPYFSFSRRGDTWHRLNLQFIADVRAVGDPRPLSAFVHAPVEALVRGEVAAVAADYAQAGADRVYLRIAGFDPRSASTSEVAAYRHALDAFVQSGALPVADAVGRFGLVLCATDADGFSSGAAHHHSVALSPLNDPNEMRSEPVGYEVPGRWYALPPAQARRDAQAGIIPACPLHTCAALAAGSGASDIKEHLVHCFTMQARTAAQMGAAQVRGVLQAERRHLVWLSAL